MIRIIAKIEAANILASQTVKQLPLIPGTASLTTTVEPDEKGRYKRHSLSARLSDEDDLLFRDLIVTLTFEDGSTLELGDADVPVRFTFEQSDLLTVSLDYEESSCPF